MERAFRLDGCVAVVTGGASGIGRETALVLTGAGARLVLADMDESGLAATRDLVAARGGEAVIRKVDVTSRDQVASISGSTSRALAFKGPFWRPPRRTSTGFWR